MLRFMTEGKPVQMRMDIAETMPPVMADEKRLVQILYNLLHNALKYTKKERSLSLPRYGKDALSSMFPTPA
ncbi:sensor histidine kinase [Brevibacillus panacihumi]|uniref:sensor histidine kinase n=1 Tax=Brevibacillus panacihumi TaxID=497735 RepID=UPI003CFE2155